MGAGKREDETTRASKMPPLRVDSVTSPAPPHPYARDKTSHRFLHHGHEYSVIRSAPMHFSWIY